MRVEERAMTTTRWVAVVATAAAVLAAPPADAAKRKPMSGSYPLTLPVPYPGESADGSHCREAPDGLSKHVQRITVPAPGRFTFRLTQVVGDWVIELHDTRGRMLASGASSDPVAPERKLTFRHRSRAKATYLVMVCNFTGGPQGHVAWTYVFD